MYIFSEFLVSEWSFGVNYPIICWLLTQHSRLIIWEKPQNFIEFYVKKSSQLLLLLFFITPAHSYFMNQKNGRNIFVPFFFLFLVQLDLSWSTFKYLNWQYYNCRNRDTFNSQLNWVNKMSFLGLMTKGFDVVCESKIKRY